MLRDSRRLRLLAQGRLVNPAAAEGHPAAVRDTSFENQALCVEFFAANRSRLDVCVHDIPIEIDQAVARLKLTVVGVQIDVLAPEQVAYASSRKAGT